MAPVNFKLTELNGLTRRVAFPDKPAWSSLAAKIELLYGIPIEKVSVSYVDVDNDQVTLSSQEELDDFFAMSHTDGQIIKFTVQNLSAVRLQRTLSQPSHNPSRNTFGIGTFEIEDDWQTLPIPPIPELQGLFMPNASNRGQPHAFVEILESDTGTVQNEVNAKHESVASSPMSSPESPFVVPLAKGKQRAEIDDDISSTGSVLGEDAPPKPPVHVYDFQPIESNVAARFPCIPVESTPKTDSQTIRTTGIEVMEASKDATSNTGNPTDVLSTFDDQTSRAATSFFDDLTSFLTTFSNVIASHPELSEGVRNIIRNASNGTYWHAHRNGMSQAAQTTSRETGATAEALHRETEEQARRRAVDGLDGIFRTLSETLSTKAEEPPISKPMGNTQSANEAKPTEKIRTAKAQNLSTIPVDPPRPFVPDPLFDIWMHGEPRVHGGSQLPRPLPFIPVPPRYSNGPGYAPMCPPPLPSIREIPGSWHGWVPPPPPPPPPRPPGPYPRGPPPPTDPSIHTPPGHHFSPYRPPSPMEASRPFQGSKLTPQELRAQVDEAKARYRAEKAKYRLDRAERRKEREMKEQVATPELDKPSTSILPGRPITPPAIAVQGRSGQSPREDGIQRYNTHLGHGSSSRRHRGHSFEHSDLRTRAVNRIAKRLADMGFSEGTHPDLPNKIKARLPLDGIVKNDSEDDIVTTLLEDLLALSPKPPVASGSGAREHPTDIWD